MSETNLVDQSQIEAPCLEVASAQSVCFCCGVCCAKYQPRLDLAEARRIANALGLKLEEFLKNYADKRWPGTKSFLLRKRCGSCIFLKKMPNRKEALCLIHPFRPSSCREWVAGLHQRECQEGLAKCWGLTVGEDGYLAGSARRMKRFERFLKLCIDGSNGSTSSIENIPF